MKRWFLVLLCLASSAALADEARDIWMAKCKSCHGEDGRAKTKAGEREKIPDLTTAQWQKKHTDTDIRLVIENGSPDNRKMKAYKGRLSMEEIDALVGLIRDFKATH